MYDYVLAAGYVQPMIINRKTGFMCHFGLPVRDCRLPVINDYTKRESQNIIDLLNNGEITEDEARELLKKI